MSKITRFLFVLGFASSFSLAIDSSSRYLQLGSDFLVTSNSFTGQIVLQTTISFTTGKYVFLESDGRFFPFQEAGLATVEIRVDGVRAGNASILDFRVPNPVQHSFNAIGLTYVGPGTHTFQLVGFNHPSILGGKFKIGAGANLSVVVNPASSVTLLDMATDSQLINVITSGWRSGGPLNYVAVINGTHNAPQAPVVMLTSGRAYNPTTGYGDSMFGTFNGNVCPSNDQHFWTVQDLAPLGELHAPLFGHALYYASGSLNPRLAASELPFINPPMEDEVRYKVGSTTALIALSGNIPINGGQAELPSVNCDPNTYIFVGNGSRTFWNKSFTVQAGQNGNVMFLLKTRILDCFDNEGPGTVSLQLELDGQPVGSTGVQQFVFDETCHQRTISASYLALGLSTGTHSVRGRIIVSGLPNLSASGDMGLLYFGN